MKPLNLDNSPCSPISSNCVIWQGPNIPCIKLCTGDTVSDVVFKLATELCAILETLDVNNYDLACLNLAGCDPKDFQTLIQILINKICDLQNAPVPAPDDKSGGCPVDCIVAVADCFGGGNENLLTYVDNIGNKICELIIDITELNNKYDTLVIVTEDLQEQIDNLPVYTLPSIDPDCQIGPYNSSTPLDALFEAFLNDVWCPFSTVTGTAPELFSAITSQCVTGADTALEFKYSLTSPSNQIGVYYNGSWVNSPATIADAINNIWIALCDVRKAGHQLTVVAAGTGVTVTSATAVVGNDQVTTYTVSAGATHPELTVTDTPCGGGISLTTDVYAYIDITSGPYAGACSGANKLILAQALSQWHTDYQLANPLYTGNLYIFQYDQPEDYLNLPNKIKTGTPSGTWQWLNPADGTTVGAVTPPNWNTLGWVAPTDILFIAFVNESNPVYHCTTSPADFLSCPPAQPSVQPTSQWSSNYNTFVTDYNTHWNFFKGVIYPAADGGGSSANFCLHAFGATNNIANITLSDLTTALGPNLASLGAVTYPISNPYVPAAEGLWNYGWVSKLDKGVTAPCNLDFTAQDFEDDLNELLGIGTNCTSASVIESWDELTQNLSLRGLTSCSLDISVDESGCIAIESATNPLETLNEGVTLTTNTTSLNFVGDLINATTAGDNVTVTVNTFGGMLAQQTPANLNSVSFGLANVLCFQPVQVIAQIYDDANAYDPLTGIWTCPETGRYNLSCYAHYTRDAGTGWYDAGNPGGMFGVGIFTSTGCNFYCANWMTVMGVQKHIDITAQAIGMSIAAGTQLSVKVLNQTGLNYVSLAGDAIRFSIERIK